MVTTTPDGDLQQPGRLQPTAKSRIGLIVAASMAAGLVAAAVLVAAPFVPAKENVLTGVVLLGFALGWALLAVLSVRFSDQPQRWAAAPAAFMAVAGLASLSGSAAVHDVLSWVWPPVLFGLVVWMFLRVRRQLRSRGARWLLYPVLAVLGIASVGGGYETVRESLDARAYPMPGQLVDVGGHRLHLHCTGSGSPTVVLEPGQGGASSDFAWIAPAVARDTTVCVYDRAGRGWSDAADSPQDGDHIAADLHTLLDRAHVPGPYVLAGHSFGGLYVLSFAAQFPDQVAGLVLLDSTAPKPGPALPTDTESYSALGRVARTGFRGRPPRSRTPDRPVVLRQSSAARPGRGARQRVDRPPPRQLHRGVRRGEHVDAAGVVPDQPRRQAADRLTADEGTTTINGKPSRTTWPPCRPTVSTVTLTPPTNRSSTTKPTPPQPARPSTTSSPPYAPATPCPSHARCSTGHRRDRPARTRTRRTFRDRSHQPPADTHWR